MASAGRPLVTAADPLQPSSAPQQCGAGVSQGAASGVVTEPTLGAGDCRPSAEGGAWCCAAITWPAIAWPESARAPRPSAACHAHADSPAATDGWTRVIDITSASRRRSLMLQEG